MKVSIIILNYKSASDTIRCAKSMLDQKYEDYEIIIVDNNSNDDSIEVIKKEFGEIEVSLNVATSNSSEIIKNQLFLLCNSENSGYSAGNNIGIKLAIKNNADAVLIINPDVEVTDKDFLSKLTLPFKKYNRVGISAPMVLDHLGRKCNPIREPNGFEAIMGITFIPLLKRLKILIDDRYVVSTNDITSHYIIADKVHGCCLMLSIKFLGEIGYLDEHNFMYCEEAILAQQLKSYDYSAYVCNDTIAKHLHSLKASSKNRVLFFESRKYFMKKYRPYNIVSTKILIMLYNSFAKYFLRGK